MKHLAQHIESLIFTADAPISFGEIRACLEETFGLEFHQEELEKAISQLKEKYQDEAFSFEMLEIAEGYQFLTKGAYHNTVGTLLKQKTRKRLSRAALETLAIVAYKQPVSKSEIEKIRGVNSDYALQKLLEKELVSIVGRSEGPGKPLLYGAGDKFMNYFGLKSIKDLPQPKEFKDPENLIGEPEEIEEIAEESADLTTD
ncbi:SMC-Scp complex subunit ScpB [Haliscomenobacter hydrossis]|uniref:Chromosome segregation and condensation protein, ScpB n=1 Tax=Haliscomenobacter hydrossis (strain ATCC 27775 / DSM 1100 / LMG 10767 / O) TaxID=760192 RepID=F4KPQ4_HALH1|nr:SMC-Scp complex subunit ScpB [Haliscomenobacter hydrossis]AEE52154.1 chromosome segregation and condensation protein, ScpB [Haliscomenobacter hydrossis DSM 1100]